MSFTSRSRRLNICSGLTLLSLAAVAAVGADSAAAAATDRTTELDSIYTSSATVATNIPRIHTFTDAPRGFDPLTADEADLAAYGFPPRPDPTAEPQHYALWKRAMGAAKIRWHGALKPIAPPKATADSALSLATTGIDPALSGPLNTTSANWGGVVLTKALTKWNSGQSFRDIYSNMTVPVGQPTFAGGCDVYLTRTWAGLDGYAKTSALQPGAGQGALIGGYQTYSQCSSSDTSYYAIFGWEPGDLQAAFAVSPGDLVYTEVTAPAKGIYNSYLFIEDLTTLTYNAYSIPVDYTFIGNSAEWVVERPCCEYTGKPYPLVNSIDTFFDGGAALDNAGHTLYPGSPTTSTRVLTMLDDAGDQNILEVFTGSAGQEGLHAISLATTGCAYVGGCAK